MPGVDLPEDYVRPDPEPGPHLSAIEKSYRCVLNDGKEKTFPSLEDYVAALAEQGVNGYDDLVENHGHLIGEIFFSWIRHGQLGCIFAIHLSKTPRESLWLPIVQYQVFELGTDLGQALSAQLDGATNVQEAVAIIFPEIKSGHDVVALVNALCGDPSGRWYWTQEGLTPDENGNLEHIGLRWILKSGESVNFVLGFANIPSMPLTRRSPFAALFLRIGDFKRTPATREDSRIQVHLADLDSKLPSKEAHDLVWDRTQVMRQNYVEAPLSTAARAKVTFSVFKGEAAALCEPRCVTLEGEAK